MRHAAPSRKHGLFEEAHCLGLDPWRTSFLGKDYSTSAQAFANFQREYHHVESVPIACGLPGSPEWSPWTSGRRLSARYLLHQVSYLFGASLKLERMGTKMRPRALLIDDGAELIDSLAEAAKRENAVIGAVEQTRFGARRLREKPVDFPVVNVAESPVKLHMESVLIGESVASNADRTIQALRAHGVSVGNNLALVGFGAVGHATALSLKARGYQVVVVESDPEQARQAIACDFVVQAKDDALSHADVVLGTTGKSILTGGDFGSLKNGAVLISASSSTVEFGTGSGADVSPPTAEGTIIAEIAGDHGARGG